MSNDPSTLKYMGTQSHETMAMEAAMAERAHRSTEQGTDAAAESSAVGKATDWAVDKAKDTLRAGAGYVGERATAALRRHVGQDPLRPLDAGVAPDPDAGRDRALVVRHPTNVRRGADSPRS